VTLVVVIVAVVALVLALGILILFLMRRSQRAVPDLTDRHAARRDAVVAVDDDGGGVVASQEGDTPARDDAAFEEVLKDELKDLGRGSPRS
jgi:hypothetical protein